MLSDLMEEIFVDQEPASQMSIYQHQISSDPSKSSSSKVALNYEKVHHMKFGLIKFLDSQKFSRHRRPIHSEFEYDRQCVQTAIGSGHCYGCRWKGRIRKDLQANIIVETVKWDLRECA